MAGQTLSEIRALLAGAGLEPQHRFGQNFLIDLNLMRKLVAAADVCPADVLLEVGAGTGSLTEMLLAGGARVVAVEIDRGLQRVLAERFAGERALTLIGEDVLAGKHVISPRVIEALAAQAPGPNGGRKLVANLPYQVATPLLVELLLAPCPLSLMVCTIQKEVGERLSAAPRSEAYGPVSILMDALAEVETIAELPPRAFWPRPKVDSVMVRIRPRPAAAVEVENPAAFAAFVQRAFQQRRKMLRRALRDWEDGAALAALDRCGFNPRARPEELSPQQWRTLYRSLPCPSGR